jgi:hypothetical protein
MWRLQIHEELQLSTFTDSPDSRFVDAETLGDFLVCSNGLPDFFSQHRRAHGNVHWHATPIQAQ